LHNAIQEKGISNPGSFSVTEWKRDFASELGNLAYRNRDLGELSAAERNLRRQIDLCREIADEFREAVGHEGLGSTLFYCGNWKVAEQELNLALSIYEKLNDFQGQSVLWAYRALRFLLMAREEAIFDTRKSNNEYRKSAIESAQHALELSDDFSRQQFRVERDYVRVYWLLGSAYRANNELTLAEENLSKALNLCRKINAVDAEAEILLDLARLRYAQGDFKDAQEKAAEALVITERSGYVLQGADVNLFLATLEESREQRGESSGGKERARKYAEEALRLATCDGPPYYYKVAYEEAERMLARLK
jgi:tetratricopeptide (TPR) repeat protein